MEDKIKQDFINVLIKRRDRFIDIKHHNYEADKLKDAISTVHDLVPAEYFNDLDLKSQLSNAEKRESELVEWLDKCRLDNFAINQLKTEAREFSINGDIGKSYAYALNKIQELKQKYK